MTAQRQALFLSILATVLLAGCASTTQVRTDPAGAEIIMDNTIKLGKSPIEYREMVWVWTSRRFEARLPGYETEVFQIPKKYPWGQNLAVCFCSGFILWPVVFASGYEPSVNVSLRPASASNGTSEPLQASPLLAFDSSS